MAHIAGRTGMVYIGADIAGCKSWSIDYTVDILDTTDFADGAAANSARTFLPGLSQWSGSFEIVKDGAPMALGTSATPVALKLEEDTTTFWSGNAFITGIHATNSVEGLVMYAMDFQGTGELTESAA